MSTVTPSMTRDRFNRLNACLKLLEELDARKAEFVTVAQLAKATGATTGTIVDDIATLRGDADVPFDLDLGDLLRDVRGALGRDNRRDVFLAGTTPLARSILECGLAGEHGLNVVAVFDDNPHLVGTELSGRQVMPYEKLAPLATRMNVRLGIVAVEDAQAQRVADLMVVGGIEALVCCGSAAVDAPDGVTVVHYDLGKSMSRLVADLR